MVGLAQNKYSTDHGGAKSVHQTWLNSAYQENNHLSLTVYSHCFRPSGYEGEHTLTRPSPYEAYLVSSIF